MKDSPFAGWKAHVDHICSAFGRCAAEVRRNGIRGQCFRGGEYAWHGVGYCYQHHPDIDAYIQEMHRITEIAQAAIEQEGA